ncbi:patatin-like phospholipase family protein [Corallincola spongiicola]|uniref:Patatin-like phospholipase family protein n=1 Tax=Corallincola spongiicola TaxID=2520508 RepID=A0ABY1WMZ1_9GAMM|nr:patatin-like phospholipase family protein [Corallincola spongiicola]TAA43777.1 patatin-like phospholipase family protein [Corallincola spongiicola]
MVATSSQPPTCALLLTGGGARAAYQVGVLKAIASLYPRNHAIPFPIICGTSAGAINGTALACYASCFHLGIRKLEWVWKNFRINQVYRTDLWGVFGHLLQNIMSNFQADYAYKRPVSLLDNAPLRELLEFVLDFKRIDRNIINGALKALTVTASCYTSGDSICFFQEGQNRAGWQRARRSGVPTIINPQHLMASSAIPGIFPSVRINQAYFGDGSVHQLAPLSPAVHLGADKLFVIGVEKPMATQYRPKPAHHPSIATVAGHLLDTVFADTLNSDLERLHRINNTLSKISPEQRDDLQLREIETLVINPTHDFRQVAAECYSQLPLTIRSMLKLIGVNRHSESSLVSYLMFEQSYCQQLIEIGYQDGIAQQKNIRDFLGQ